MSKNLDILTKEGIGLLHALGDPGDDANLFLNQTLEKHPHMFDRLQAGAPNLTFHQLAQISLAESFCWMRFLKAGRPVFKLTPELTAELLLTNTSGIKAEDLKFPFTDFALEIPNGFIPIWGENESEEYSVNPILVNTFKVTNPHMLTGELLVEERLRLMMYAEGSPSSFKLHLDYPLREWNRDDLFNYEHTDASTMAQLPNDQITNRAAARLVTSFLIWYEIQSYENPKGPFVHQPYANKHKQRREAELPYFFVQRQPISLDKRMVEAAKDHVRLGSKHTRKGWELSIQTTVIGHTWNQPYGPRHSLRRKAWRRPHIRGKDLPVMAIHDYEAGHEE